MEIILILAASSFVAGWVLGKLVKAFNKRYEIRRRNPYVWSCHRCSFIATSTHMDTLMLAADWHEKGEHP